MKKRAAPTPARVVLAIRTPLVREAIESAIESPTGVEVVSHSSDPEELRAMRVEAAEKCVILLGVTLAKPLLAVEPNQSPAASQCRVLVLANPDTESEQLAEFLRMGAAGVVTSDVHPEELMRAIQLVNQEMVVMPMRVWCSMALEAVLPPLQHVRVSAREQQILELWAQGASDKEVSTQLAISRRTLHTYLGRLKVKLGSTSRSHTVAIAIAARIVPMWKISLPGNDKDHPRTT